MLKSSNFRPPKFEFVFLVEENGGFDFGAKVAAPRAHVAWPPAKRGGVAWRKEALEPGDVVHKLDVISLGDDLGSGLLPQLDSADVVRVAMRQDDVLDRPVVLGSQQFLGIWCHRGCGRIDHHIPSGCGHQVDVACDGSHVYGVADFDGVGWRLRGGVGGDGKLGAE